MNNITVQIIEGSKTSVALVNADGTGQVQTLQQLANQIARISANLAAATAIQTQVVALGLTLPSANI